MNYREMLKDKKRIVVKVGSSSLIHKETNKLNLRKLEVLVRELSDLTTSGQGCGTGNFRCCCGRCFRSRTS